MKGYSLRNRSDRPPNVAEKSARVPVPRPPSRLHRGPSAQVPLTLPPKGFSERSAHDVSGTEAVALVPGHFCQQRLHVQSTLITDTLLQYMDATVA